MSGTFLPLFLARAVRSLGFALVGLSVSAVAMADESLLYDIDFSAPTHTLNARPASGTAPNKVSGIAFGSPTVVASFGALTDRPLLFNGDGDPYDQIILNGNFQIETCRLEFDLVTEGLKDSGLSFTVFFDTPSVRRFSLDGTTNKIESSTATWQEGRLLHCTLFADLKNNRWEASVDGQVVFSFPINAAELRSIRFSHGRIGSYRPDVKAAIDNVRVTVTKRVTPEAPALFSATGGTGASAVTLSWSGVPGADSYRIYRSNFSSTSSSRVIAETTGLRHEDATLQTGRTYYYWVKAVKGGYESPFGIVAPARIDLAPPSGLTVSGPERGDGVFLSWNASARAGSYRIYRNQTNSFSSATFLASTSALNYLDSAAAPGARSYYWVESVLGSTISPDKASGSGIRGLAMVTNLTATFNTSANGIELQWNPVMGATGYRVHRGESEIFEDATPLALVMLPGYSDPTVSSDRTYRYWVTPVTSLAEGAAGVPATGDTSSFQPDLWFHGKYQMEYGRGVVENSLESDLPIVKHRNRSALAFKLWVDVLGRNRGRVAIQGPAGNRNFNVAYYFLGRNATAEAILGRLEVASGHDPVLIVIEPSRMIESLPGEQSFPLRCRGVSTAPAYLEDRAGLAFVSQPKRIPKPTPTPPAPGWKPKPEWVRPSPEDR